MARASTVLIRRDRMIRPADVEGQCDAINQELTTEELICVHFAQFHLSLPHNTTHRTPRKSIKCDQVMCHIKWDRIRSCQSIRTYSVVGEAIQAH
jgi:hypothetical protein